MGRKNRLKCGARTRSGDPCRAPAVRGKARCRLHGGLSTGPKTEEGRARVRDGYRRALIADLEQRELDRASGLYAPYYCGADMSLRARYGSPSDRHHLAEHIAVDPANAEQHQQNQAMQEAERKLCSEPLLPQPTSPAVLPDWDPFDL